MPRVVFMGTPDFAVPTLRALIAHHTVIGVVTQPDRPAGRGAVVQPPPIKVLAQQHGIPVLQPEKLRRQEAIAALRAVGDADFFVVAAFGQILPQTVLDLPRFGSINVHASLLPRWRGAAPIQAAIRAGDSETGITIMQMDAGLDTGPMLSRVSIPIAPDETGESLHDKLMLLGAELLIPTLAGILAGTVTPQPQDDALATFAPQIQKDDGRIAWAHSAAQIDRTVRAFTPWPGTFTHWHDGQMLKILSGAPGAGQAEPGRVVLRGGRVGVGTGDGLYYPLMVQLAGKKPTPLDDFVRGRPEFVGAMLGQ